MTKKGTELGAGGGGAQARRCDKSLGHLRLLLELVVGLRRRFSVSFSRRGWRLAANDVAVSVNGNEMSVCLVEGLGQSNGSEGQGH